MQTLRRLSKLSDAHPLLSIALGLIVIVVFGLVLLPADPPQIDAVAHSRSAT